MRIFVYSVLVALSCVSCSKHACSAYNDLAADNSSAAEIIEWADASIFSLKFTEESLEVGGLREPGGRLISDQRLLSNIPNFLRGSEVRLLGSDPTNPIGVFVGTGRLLGIVVSRADIASLVAAKEIYPDEISIQSSRIASLCGKTER